VRYDLGCFLRGGGGVGGGAVCPPAMGAQLHYLRIENAEGYVLIAVFLFIYLLIYLFVCVLFAKLKKY